MSPFSKLANNSEDMPWRGWMVSRIEKGWQLLKGKCGKCNRQETIEGGGKDSEPGKEKIAEQEKDIVEKTGEERKHEMKME